MEVIIAELGGINKRKYIKGLAQYLTNSKCSANSSNEYYYFKSKS